VLQAEQVKPFLCHQEKMVREHAANYFYSSCSRDADLMPLILESCNKYGEEENSLLLAYASNFPQTENTLRTVLERLENTSNFNAIHHYNHIISWADHELVEQFFSKIRNCKNIFPATLDMIKRRLSFIPCSTETLWFELMDYCDEIAHKRLDQIYYPHGLHMVEILAQRDDLPAEDLVEFLQDGETYYRYEELYWTILAGEAQIEEAIPVLLDKLRIDTDFLCDEASKSLIKIGTDRVIEELKSCFPSESWHFRNFSAHIFGDIKSSTAENALLELLPVETDPTIKAHLGMGACNLISENVVPKVKALIDANDYDYSMVDLREPLYAVCQMLQIDLEELGDWKKDLQQHKEATRQRMKVMDNSFPLSPLNFLSLDQTQHNNKTRKIGRNEPCPCRSGEKYKKCCGNI